MADKKVHGKGESVSSSSKASWSFEKHLWIAVCLGCVIVLGIACLISRVANRGIVDDVRQIRKGGAAAMRRAAVGEGLRINRMLRHDKTVDVLQTVKKRKSLPWSREVEQILHDLAYGIGSMRTMHLVFGQDPELRADMAKRHVPFDDLFLELEDANGLIVNALSSWKAKIPAHT